MLSLKLVVIRNFDLDPDHILTRYLDLIETWTLNLIENSTLT